MGRSHRRRDGPRVAEHHVLQRRGLQRRAGEARRSGKDHYVRGRATIMKKIILMTAAIAAAVIVNAASEREAVAERQGQGQLPSQFPLSLGLREKGSSLTGAFEGWYHDKDGSVRVLVGYLNRNTKQEFDIPVGPNNRIDPGGPDQGQPTHFQSGRQWGVFTVKMPKDLGDKKLTWTLVANGFTNTITLHTRPDYIIEPFEDAASKNTPPVVKFEP